MAQYRTGRVLVKNGSATVIANSAADWTDIDVGDWFALRGSNLAISIASITETAVASFATWSNATTYAFGDRVKLNGVAYVSLQASNLNKDPEEEDSWWAVTSGWSLDLTANWAGSSAYNKEYGIVSEFTDSGLPLPQPGDVEIPAIVSRAFMILSSDLEDRAPITPDQTDAAGGTVLSWHENYFDTFDTDRTLSFEVGTPTEGTTIELRGRFLDEVTLSFPMSVRVGTNTTVDSLLVPQGFHEFSWKFCDGMWWLADSVRILSFEDDITSPTKTALEIPAAGTTIELTLSEAVQFGSGGNGGLTLTATGGAVTATYASGENSNVIVYSLSRTIAGTETVTASYTQPSDGIEDFAGNDLATFTSQAVANNSII